MTRPINRNVRAVIMKAAKARAPSKATIVRCGRGRAGRPSPTMLPSRSRRLVPDCPAECKQVGPIGHDDRDRSLDQSVVCHRHQPDGRKPGKTTKDQADQDDRGEPRRAVGNPVPVG